MNIQNENISIRELTKMLDKKNIDKVVDYAFNKAGYFKCAEVAVYEGVSRQAISLRVKGDKYHTVEYGGFLYAKKK